MATKICKKCKVEKSTDCFYKHSGMSDGLLSFCKECVKERTGKRYEDKKEEILEKQHSYTKTHWDKIKKTQKEYYTKNFDKVAKQRSEYKKNNRDKFNEKERRRQATDIGYRLATSLRRRLWNAINNNQKVGSAVRDLGCTIVELKVYLESKFLAGMAWSNWGHDHTCWHIDHIRPLASFDLTDREQFLQACHYTNLQPMWAIDNLKKGCKE